MSASFSKLRAINLLHANHHAAVVRLIERRPDADHESEIFHLVEKLNQSLLKVEESHPETLDELGILLAGFNLNLKQIVQVLETFRDA